MTPKQAQLEQAELTALWQAFGRAQRRDRARRAAAPQLTDAELLTRRIFESRGDTDEITRMSLGLAVPMWIDRMLYWRPSYREQVAQELVEITAGDQGMAALCDRDAALSSKRHNPGEMADAFNAVAQGLACLAFCPGGVVFAGYHWEVTPEAPVPRTPTQRTESTP